ncbi:hypothetical protein chiPu_0029347, partial [Chiloscyllium punctatum]|nr:hypothetical protein [Chiloscyllium punctatum]
MIRTVERHRLADVRACDDHGPARMEVRLPGLGELARQFGARGVGRAAGTVGRDLLRGDRGRGHQRRDRGHQPDRNDREQRHAGETQRGDRNQRQRHQEEQRNAPVGLDIDGECQRAERRPDRDDRLDDPDVERLRKVDGRIGSARPDPRQHVRRPPWHRAQQQRDEAQHDGNREQPEIVDDIPDHELDVELAARQRIDVAGIGERHEVHLLEPHQVRNHRHDH